MNQHIHAIKAQIVDRLRHDSPKPTDRIAQLEADNAALRAYIVRLELLHVSSIGLMLAPAPLPELAKLHVDDVRRVMSQRGEVAP